jgi:hypothetical protein
VKLYNPFEDVSLCDQLGPLCASVIELHRAGLEIPLYITWDGFGFNVTSVEPTGASVGRAWFMRFARGADPAMMRHIPREQHDQVHALIEDGSLIPFGTGNDVH